MNDIETFLAKHQLADKQKKTSVLEPYQAEILELKEKGYSDKIIVRFLEEMKGVKVSQQWLNRYIRSCRKQAENSGLRTAPVSAKPHSADDRQAGVPVTQIARTESPNEDEQEAERIGRLHNVRVGTKKFQQADDIDTKELI